VKVTTPLNLIVAVAVMRSSIGTPTSNPVRNPLAAHVAPFVLPVGTGNVTVTVSAADAIGGVSFGLNNIMLLAKGEPLGGARPSAAPDSGISKSAGPAPLRPADTW